VTSLKTRLEFALEHSKSTPNIEFTTALQQARNQCNSPINIDDICQITPTVLGTPNNRPKLLSLLSGFVGIAAVVFSVWNLLLSGSTTQVSTASVPSATIRALTTSDYLANASNANSSLGNSSLANATLANATLANATLANATLGNATLGNATLDNAAKLTLGNEYLVSAYFFFCCFWMHRFRCIVLFRKAWTTTK